MAENGGPKIAKLNGENYQSWKFNMKCLLMERGLWGFIRTENPIIKPEIKVLGENANADEVAKSKEKLNEYNLKADKAYSLIALSVESDLQVHVSSKTTAKDAWIALQGHFEFVSVTQIVRLMRRFYAAKMEEKGDMMKHITEMTSLSEQLREMKQEVSSKIFAIVILGSLPDSYDNFLTSMNARNADDLDWNNVKGHLIEEYMKRQDKEKQNVGEEALFTRGGGDGNYDRGNRGGGRRSRGGGAGNRRRGGGHHGRFSYQPYNNRPNNSRVCYNCNQPGHIAAGCPLREEEEQASLAIHQNFHEDDIALLAATVDTATNEAVAVIEDVDDDYHEDDIALLAAVDDSTDNNNEEEEEKESLSENCIASEKDRIINDLSDTDNNNEEEEEEESLSENCIASEKDHRVINDSSDSAIEDEEEISIGFENEIALVTSDEAFSVSHEWCIDSGASKHMTNNDKILKDMIYYDEPKPVYLGDKSFVLSHGEGKLRLRALHPKGTYIALKEVLYVPKLMKNLLSVRTMTKQDAEVRFIGDKCLVVKQNKNGTSCTVEIGKSVNGGLYKLYSPVISKPSEEKACFATTNGSLSLWHQRYGHLNMKDITHISKNDVVDGMKTCNEKEENIDDCESCALGKMHRLPHPKQSENRANKILEMVHTDLCGPMQIESVGGSRYLLTFIDDYSRYTVVYLLKRKSEVTSKFKEFVMLMENNSHQIKKLNVINSVRSDNGGEYRSDEFKKYCSEKGISQQFTNPYCPQQNGVSERLNRTIVESARSMLCHAKLPLKFWAEAVNTVVYLRNRSPTSALNGRTPFEYWFNRKPDVSNLRVFGCICYVHIPDALRKKLDPKSYKAIFVGYPSDTKGYKVYNVNSGKFCRSRNIIFSENKFHDFNSVEKVEDYMIFPEELYIETNHDNKVDRIDVEKEGDDNGGDVLIEEVQVNNVVGEEINKKVRFQDDDSTVKSTYEETFMDQVANLNGPRLRNPRDRLIENADFAVTDSCYVASLTSDADEPKTYKQATNGQNFRQWKNAMDDEYNSLKVNKTWELVPRPSNQNVIGCRWLYKLKRGVDGSITRYKSRLVAQGYSQTEGIDYEEVFAPVARAATIRALLSFANSNNLEVHQMDVKTAFLHGVLDCDLYMEQPEGYVDPEYPDYVCKLIKGLYGLKQAAKCWNETLDKHLIENGYTRAGADSCLYLKIKNGSFVIMGVYVDDFIPVSNDTELMIAEKAALSKRFDLVDNGNIEYFLGMLVKRDREKLTLTISQPNYVETVLAKFGMSLCKPVATPMDVNVHFDKLREEDEKFDIQTYQKAIGSLTYLSTSTRPDIAASVGILSQFMSNPGTVHWVGVKRIFRYLKGTCDHGLKFVGDVKDELVGFSDSDWAGDLVTRRSTSGYVYQFGQSTLSWCSRRQKTVAKSSTEAEYVALSIATQEAIWLRRLFADIGVVMKSATKLYEDNQGAIDLSKNPKHHNRTKHIDVSYHFTRERIASKEIDVGYVPTTENLADIMTKALSRGPYEKFRDALGVVKCS